MAAAATRRANLSEETRPTPSAPPTPLGLSAAVNVWFVRGVGSFTRALEVRPQFAAGYFCLGEALQQMGRVHRTNQAFDPHYLFLFTALGGEQRFVSALAKRLASLGALTRGDCAAALAGLDPLGAGRGMESSSRNWDTAHAGRALTVLSEGLPNRA